MKFAIGQRVGILSGSGHIDFFGTVSGYAIIPSSFTEGEVYLVIPEFDGGKRGAFLDLPGNLKDSVFIEQMAVHADNMIAGRE